MKDIYELLNYAEVDLSEFDETPLNDIDKKKFKNIVHKGIRSNRKTFIKVIKAGAIAISIISLTAFASYKVSPTFATGIPVVGNIIKNITGYGDKEFDKYTSVINKTVEDKGIKVTLKEIMLDDNQLRIGINIKNNMNMKNGYVYSDMLPDIFIDGAVLNSKSGGTIGEKVNDDGEFVMVNTIDIHNIKIPNEMKIKIVYNNFNFGSEGKKEKVVKGKWEFEANISKEQIKSKTQKIKINKNIIGKESNMKIEDITITPLTTNINFKLKGEKPLGFIIEDDKGKVLTQESASYGSSGIFGYIGNYKKGNISFSSVSKNAKKLNIIPYNNYSSSNDKPKEYAKTKPVRLDNNSLPITLRQNNENKIIVYKIEKKDDKVYVYYRTEGISYDMQRYRLYLYNDNKNLLDCIYGEGNLLKVNNKNEMIVAVFKDNNKGNIYLGTDDMKDIDIIKSETLTVDLE